MESELFRRVRGYAAWVFVAAAAVEVLIGAWALSGLPGGPLAGVGYGPAVGHPFWLRAETAVNNLLPFDVTALPVVAVMLVALGRRPAPAARIATRAAVAIQAVALVLGLIAWLGTIGKTGLWTQISLAIEFAIAATGLILTAAVLLSQAGEPLTRPQVRAGQH